MSLDKTCKKCGMRLGEHLVPPTPRLQCPDPRPDDTAQLAREVARELRRRMSAIAANDSVCVARLEPDRICPRASVVMYSLCSSDFDNLGPVAIADAIVAAESKLAQELAGDK